MTDQPIISIDSIDQYNKMYGFETFHPLVSVVDIADAAPDHRPNHITLRYGLYALWLKNLNFRLICSDNASCKANYL